MYACIMYHVCMYPVELPLLQGDSKLLETQTLQRQKRSPGSVEFMGMRVSYPQYLRLKSIQTEVIRMDKMIRSMLARYKLRELEANPYWIELVDLYETMKKILPAEYLESQDYADPMRHAQR